MYIKTNKHVFAVSSSNVQSLKTVNHDFGNKVLLAVPLCELLTPLSKKPAFFHYQKKEKKTWTGHLCCYEL